jgi:hypothetical protein
VPTRTDSPLAEGLYTISVKNRNDSPAAEYKQALTVVPPPTLDQVNPEIVCKDQDCWVTLTGQMFVKIADRVGRVTIGEGAAARDFQPVLGECRKLPSAASLDIQACTTATVGIPAKIMPVGQQAVTITNPDPVGCHSTARVILTFVPEPTVVSIAPDLECVDDGDQPMKITGTDFLSIDGRLPTVLVSDTLTFTATRLDGCTSVAGPVRTRAESCTSLSFTLPKGSVPPGLYAVRVMNPAPADCTSTTSANLVIVPSPTLDAVVPDLACNAQGVVTVALRGTGFVTVDGKTPKVTFTSPTGTPFEVAASGPSGCTPIAGIKENAASCTGLVTTVPQAQLPPGVYGVVVTNPETPACKTKQARTLLIVPPPTVTAINPPLRCNVQANIALAVTGSDFYTVDGVLPTVRFTAGTDVVSIVASAASGCAAVVGVAQTVQKCTGLELTATQGQLHTGDWAVTVLNPAPVACVSSENVVFKSTPPPTLSSVTPTRICRGGATLSLAGTYFASGMVTTLGGLTAGQTTVASDSAASATFGMGLTPSTTPYPMTVTNVDGCFATLPDAVTVETGPIVFFADPPVVYNGISTVVTIYGSAELRTDKPIQSVIMNPTGSTTGGVALTIVEDAADSSRVQVQVPKGTPAGEYDFAITSSGPCPAMLPKAIKVTQELTLTITSMTPAFGGATQNTPATIKGTGFVATPRGYLSPANGNAPATALRATAFLDGATLTTLVRSGLQVGSYNLIVVNADGGVGLLENAFKVTATLPPEITDIAPGSVPSSSPPPVTIEGANFAGDATVELACVDANGVSAWMGGPIPANVLSRTSSSITIAVPVGQMATARACIIRVNNVADGTFGEYSALTITNPSQNLGALKAGTTLNTARRALAAVAGRANSAARYLYAIGGDDGTTANALRTVEVASVDLFGTLGAWTTLPYVLPGRTTFVAAVAIDNHIYVVGGHDGSTATRTVLRAVVQDPLEVPQIDDVDLTAGAGLGLGGGTWYYRVSAVMGAAHATNPEGETLASDPFVITLPDFSDKIQVKLTWKPFPGAASYRVYRSPTANLGSGQQQLIDTMPAPASGNPSYTDAGKSVVQPIAVPLPVGTTTKWVPIASLNTARAGAGVTALPSPADPSKVFIYAIGGRDAAGAALGSYEVMTVTLGAGGQATGTWTSGTALPAGSERWQLAAFAAEPTTSSYITAGTAFIYAGSGVAANGTTVVGETQAFPVNLADGTLGAAVDVKSMNGAGYGSMIANNTLYVFGGGPTPDGTASSGKICEASGAGCAGPPPTLANNSWNALGGISLDPRYLMGSTLESSFVYLVGGTNGTAPLATTLMTLW